MEFIFELLFIVFVLLMSLVGLLALGALLAGLLFVSIAFLGWILTLVNDDRLV